ncbi:hypothetical protein IQ66_07615 [Leptospira borgpetersenii serovar Ballum]|nr:hypothetical protein IQ66_07615 [Leptospira borgpetersenii serovar Ballum]
MWHHNRIRLPFSIVIADGGNDPKVEHLLSDPKNFPNLSYRYFHYHDLTIEDYWFKLADIITKIETTYVMFSDNDDFILPDAVARAGALLDAHSDYISVCSTTLNFALKDQNKNFEHLLVMGDMYNFSSQEGTNYDATNVIERIKQFLNLSNSFLYAVTRTEAWIDIFQEVKDINFKNFDVWEKLIYLSIVIKGKVFFSLQPSYLRQLGSSETHASVPTWIYRLFFSDWMKDFHSMLSAIISRAESFSTVPISSELDKMFRQLYVDAMPNIIQNYLAMTNASKPSRFRRMIRKAKEFAWIRYLFGIYNRKKILETLTLKGLNSSQLKKVESELSEVRRTLIDPNLRAEMINYRNYI